MGTRRFNQQPQQPTRVDRANPLSRALGLYAVAGQPESCQGLLPVVSGGFSFAYGPGRRAAMGPATQIPGYIGYDLAAPLVINDDFTWVIVASATQTAAGIETHITESTGINNSFTLGSTSVSMTLDGNGGSASGDFTKPTVFVGRRVGNAAMLFINGVLSATWVTGQRTGVISGVTLGRNRTGSNNPNQTATYATAIVARAWSDVEITSFSAFPYQLSKGLAESDDYAPATGAVTGSYAITMGNTVLAAAGAVSDPGVFSTTMGNAVLAATGSVAASPTGTYSTTMGGATMAATGAAVDSGSLANTMAGVSMAAAGVVTDTGAFATTMGNAAMASTGIVGNTPTGSLAVTMGGFLMAATGTVNDTGAFITTMGGVSMSASGSVIQNATGTFNTTMADVVMAAYESGGGTGNSHGSRKRRYLRRNFP